MKIILINPNLPPLVQNKIYSKLLLPVPPAGIASIAALLEKEGNDVIIIDQYANKISNEQLIQKINAENPKIVGFSCLTPTIKNIERLVIQIRDLHKDIRIVLGNVHATVFSREILEHKSADIVVRGEGEHSMLEIVNAIKEKRQFYHIKGISFIDSNGGIFHNPDNEVEEDLDSLPHPAWHLFDLQLYKIHPLISSYEITLPIQGSRGCPYKCIFCAQEKMFKRPRYRSNDTIINEIEYMYAHFGVKRFTFIDAFFPFSIEHGLDFCDRFIKKGLHKKIKWIIETRVDKVDAKLLRKMKEAGLYLIMYGFEVGNQRILDSLNKRATVEQARRIMKDTKKARILTTGLFMLGLPGETKETCKETIRFAKEIDCDIAKFNIAVPLPGSKLFEIYRNTISKIENPEHFTSWASWFVNTDSLVYSPESITSGALMDLQTEAMFKFYMRPKLILRYIIKGNFPVRKFCYGGYFLIIKYFKIIIARIINITKLQKI
jgi:radical SAM superfamily enzyme YgiQ (UPF0313 family)